MVGAGVEAGPVPKFVLAFDEGYGRQGLVAVYSLLERTPPPLSVVVVDCGLSPTTIAALRRLSGAVTLVEPPSALDPSLPGSAEFTAATWARIFVPELVADDVTRVVFVDTDVLVRRSLYELFTVDLRGRTLGAVNDRVGTAMCVAPYGDLVPDWEASGIPPAMPLFNTGVLVIDTRRWREREVTARVLDHARRFPHGARFGDQGYVNAVLWDDWVPLDSRWNSRDADAWLAHFMGPRKPWVASYKATVLKRDYARAAREVGWEVPGSRGIEWRCRVRMALHAMRPRGRGAA